MSNTEHHGWDDVGDRLSALGLKLKYHAEQAAGDDRQHVSDALNSLSSSIDHAFEALRSAAKDPALKEDVKSVGSALAAAVSETLSGVGAELRRAARREDPPHPPGSA